jgi:hypothetical protein
MPCPLEVKIEEKGDCETYVRRLVAYASEPGSVPTNLGIPKDALAGKKNLHALEFCSCAP